MKATSPIFEGLEQFEVVLAKDSETFTELPVLVGANPEPCLISRWVLTEEERYQIAMGADVYVRTMGPITPPISLFVCTVNQEPGEIKALVDMLGIGEILPNENVDQTLSKLTDLTDDRHKS